jgi:hypothetical protein
MKSIEIMHLGNIAPEDLNHPLIPQLHGFLSRSEQHVRCTSERSGSGKSLHLKPLDMGVGIEVEFFPAHDGDIASWYVGIYICSVSQSAAERSWMRNSMTGPTQPSCPKAPR